MDRAGVDWSSVEWVMLDMDGTVLDLAFDNYFWSELLPRRFARLRGLTVEAARDALAPIFLAERGRLNWYCLDFWSAHTGLDMVAMKSEIRDRIRLLPGSAGFLDAVRATGRRLWLVTNAHPGALSMKLEQTRLARHFDRIVCAHDYGAPKEQAGFWQRLALRQPFDAGRTLFVDDSLAVLERARQQGIAQTVAIRHPDSSALPRVIDAFPSVDRLPALLPIVPLRSARRD